MFINPKIAVAEGWIQGIRDSNKQIQPNAVDFTMDTLYLVNTEVAHLSETGKTMRSHDVVAPIDGVWHMAHTRVYEGASDMFVEVPDGAVAILYTRSTLTRNGVFLMSGLYDSGFKGHIGFTLYPIGGDMTIAPGTRVGQIAFVQASSASMYAGSWSHDPNTNWWNQPPKG
mgnify:CR=1 FL=1